MSLKLSPITSEQYHATRGNSWVLDPMNSNIAIATALANQMLLSNTPTGPLSALANRITPPTESNKVDRCATSAAVKANSNPNPLEPQTFHSTAVDLDVKDFVDDLTQRGLTTQVRHLLLKGCHGITDASIPAILKLPNLQHLDLSNTSITDKHVTELCSKIFSLDLSNCYGVTPLPRKEIRPGLDMGNCGRKLKTHPTTGEHVLGYDDDGDATATILYRTGLIAEGYGNGLFLKKSLPGGYQWADSEVEHTTPKEELQAFRTKHNLPSSSYKYYSKYKI